MSGAPPGRTWESHGHVWDVTTDRCNRCGAARHEVLDNVVRACVGPVNAAPTAAEVSRAAMRGWMKRKSLAQQRAQALAEQQAEEARVAAAFREAARRMNAVAYGDAATQQSLPGSDTKLPRVRRSKDGGCVGCGSKSGEPHHRDCQERRRVERLLAVPAALTPHLGSVRRFFDGSCAGCRALAGDHQPNCPEWRCLMQKAYPLYYIGAGEIPVRVDTSIPPRAWHIEAVASHLKAVEAAGWAEDRDRLRALEREVTGLRGDVKAAEEAFERADRQVGLRNEQIDRLQACISSLTQVLAEANRISDKRHQERTAIKAEVAALKARLTAADAAVMDALAQIARMRGPKPEERVAFPLAVVRKGGWEP